MSVDEWEPGHRVGFEVEDGRRYFGEVVSVDAGQVTLRALTPQPRGHVVRSITKGPDGKDVLGPERPCGVCGGPEVTA